MASLQQTRRTIGRYFTTPLVSLMRKTGVTPDALTWTGAAVALAAGVLAATGHLFAAGWVTAVSGLFDLLDGALARSTNRASRFGAVLDSTLDRVGEAAVLVGLTVFYAAGGSALGAAVTGAALVGSQLVSYIRARAEAQGINCEVGVFTRPERVVILSVGLLLGAFGPVLLVALGVMALMSWVTAGQRLLLVWRETRK